MTVRKQVLRVNFAQIGGRFGSTGGSDDRASVKCKPSTDMQTQNTHVLIAWVLKFAVKRQTLNGGHKVE